MLRFLKKICKVISKTILYKIYVFMLVNIFSYLPGVSIFSLIETGLP